MRRVVLTFSEAALDHGREQTDEILDESSWTRTDSEEEIGAHIKCKALAEKAAWGLRSTLVRALE